MQPEPSTTRYGATTQSPSAALTASLFAEHNAGVRRAQLGYLVLVREHQVANMAEDDEIRRRLASGG